MRYFCVHHANMLLIFLVVTAVAGGTNNVCKTYSDYANKEVNPNCWYNPDVDALPLEIISRQGFPFQSYEITTEDGYILGLFRIPHNNKSVDKKRQTVYLHHGFALCSNVWFDHGPRSLAFALSNEGYDVWMANTRGTRYSRGHLTYTPEDPQFWNFSWSEVALYDVPANLKFIHKETGQKVIYVGYSMGSTISYVYTIEKKEEAHKMIKGIVSLAPVAYWTKPRTILKYLVPIEDTIKSVAEFFGIYSLAAHPPGRKSLVSRICSVYPLNYFCVQALFLVTGFDDEELKKEELPMFFDGIPDGFSLYTAYHYGQEMSSGGRFQKFDHGYFGNLRKYGSLQPPTYDVREVDLCVHLFYGMEDYLANPEDVELLHKNLRCSTLNEIRVNETIAFNHLDFIYGKSVENTLYPILFRRMKEILKKGH